MKEEVVSQWKAGIDMRGQGDVRKNKGSLLRQGGCVRKELCERVER